MTLAVRRVVRWTAVSLVGLFVILTLPVVALFFSGHLRNFYMPAEGMAPTLEKGDGFVALMNGGGAGLRRGDIVLLAVGKSTYVQRVAALPGDMIALRNGTVVLNGRPIAQRLLAAETRRGYAGMETGRRLAEQFPGETAPHEILDMGLSPVDDAPELKVPDGFVFMLGDNRDRSADSRVTRDQMGVELLPLADVRGRPILCTRGCELGR